MSETCTSPSNELWLLDTESWFCDMRGTCWGAWGLEGAEEGGVDGTCWEELWVEQRVDAGQIGVKAEVGGRGEVFGVNSVSADVTADWETGEERVKGWAAPGEVSGLLDGRMDEESVADDWATHWEEEDDTKEGGRVAEDCAEDEATVGRSNDCWLGEASSVICVSSVLRGIWLEKRRQITVKTCKNVCFYLFFILLILFNCVPQLHLHRYGLLSITVNLNYLFCGSSWKEHTTCELTWRHDLVKHHVNANCST